MSKGFIIDYNFGESNISAAQNVWAEGDFKQGWFEAKIKDNKNFW